MPRISVSRVSTPLECDQAMAVWRAANRTGRRPAGELRATRVHDRLRGAEVLLLARYGDEPAGMLMAEQFVHDPGAAVEPETGHIAMVTVHPSRWGSGIGTALLAAVQDGDAVGTGWTRLSAWIRDDNKRGLRLFAGAGFTDTGNRAHLQDGDVIQQFVWSSRA